ncbi:MAG TPA: carbohydrate ABC transporter permease [Candidatus Limnocylindria bacterium]|jgi:glucose/mannose transport system permease protein|nr:carbohydrate ABC transporter permease [Candidatus Limnocylindria bacterium]
MSVAFAARRRRGVRPGRAVLYVLLLAVAVFYLLPVYVVVVTSLKSFIEVSNSTPWDLPRLPNLDAYAAAFDRLRLAFFNSVLLVVPGTMLSALLGSLNGYVLSKWRFPGSNLVFTLLLFGMFIPYQSVLIPVVTVLQAIGLYGGIPGLVLVHVVYGIPITTLIFRNYYAAVPTELVEAARVDGSSILGIYRHIMLPLSIPAFVVVLIWQFTSIWNEFLFAVTIASDPDQQPITVALQGLAGSLLAQYQIQMAGALLTALPPAIIYVALGRYFIRGLLAGALKG